MAVEGERQALAPILQDEVYRIARELLRNAFRHAQASQIEAEIRYDDRLLRVLIRDDGKGIDPKIVKAGGRAGHWGLLGMRERAKQIGARLEFWSEAGAGTEVELSVPASIAYAKSRGGGGFSYSAKRRRTREHGFPADSDSYRRRPCASSLRHSGAGRRRTGHGAGRASLHRTGSDREFRLHRPDVTLMDLQMPGMNGIEAMIGIRSEFPNARIIVLTTYTGDVQVTRALKAGARAYILKGRLAGELLETIRAVHAGQKRIPPEVAAELAEHVGGEDLTPARDRGAPADLDRERK